MLEAGWLTHTAYQRRIKLFVPKRVNTRVKAEQKASALSASWKQQPHKSQRRVLAAERRPVKASLTASNGEAGKNGAFDFML